MQDHRSLKKAWQITERTWNDSNESISNVNTGMTKREKMLESKEVSKRLAREKKHYKKKNEKYKKHKDNELEEEEGATVSAGAPGSAGGDDGGYDSDAENPIAVHAKRLKLGKRNVQSRKNESVEQVLDRAFRNAIIGESIVAQEEDEEDMGADDEMPDMDEPEDLGGEEFGDLEGGDYEAPVDDLGAEEPVPGAGVDPVEARLAAIEARLAQIEDEHASMMGGNSYGDVEAGPEEISDLGDEIPDEMGGEFDGEDLGDEESDVDEDDEEEY